MSVSIIYIAIGLLLLFGLLLLLFLIVSNFYLDERRFDWESRRKYQYDRQRTREKRKYKKLLSRTALKRWDSSLPRK